MRIKKKVKKISMFGLDIIIIHSFFMIIINFTHIANILTTFFLIQNNHICHIIISLYTFSYID